MVLSFLFLLDLTLSWLSTVVYLRVRLAVRKLIRDSSYGYSDTSMFDVPTIDSDAVYEGEDIIFRPQVYTQRYYMINEILKKRSLNGSVNKIIDLGCAELSLFRWLKNSLIAEEYIAVDIDGELLSKSSCRAQPGTSDYLFKRNRPLNVKVLCGSADVPDLRLKGANCIVAVELIEHLYPTTLEALPYCIFGVIQPELAVFTTPNSDFNVLFRNFQGFRHDDHKFEWSREQFDCWAHNLTTRYPNYEVKIGGVGPGPPGTEHLGHCSQLAMFFRKGPVDDASTEFVEEAYRVIGDFDFPFQTLEDKKRNVLLYDTGYQLDRLSKTDAYYVDGSIVVPFRVLASIMNTKCECSDDEIKEHIPPGWKIEQNGTDVNLVLDESFYEELYSDVESDVHYDDNVAEFECPKNIDGESECWGIHSVEEEADWCEPHESNGFYASADNAGAKSSLYPPPETTKAKETLSNINNAEINVISLPKCLSLEQLTPNRVRNNSFRFSLNMDKSDRSCDIDCAKDDRREGLATSSASFLDSVGLRLEDSCSQSKAADSGYPNSSCFDMDTDFTPEQVDEIVTESESSFEGDNESLSGDEQRVENAEAVAEVVVIHENVENGDVANNNRDGEGNNMEENRPVVGEELGGVDEELAVPQEEEVAGAIGRADPPDSSDDDPASNVDTMSSVTDSVQPYDGASRGHPSVEEVDVSLLLSGITVRPYLPSTRSSSTFEAAVSDDVEDEPTEFRFPEWFLSVLNEEFAGGDGDPDFFHDEDFVDYEEEGVDNDDEGAVMDRVDEEIFDDIDEETIQGCSGDILGGGDDPLIN